MSFNGSTHVVHLMLSNLVGEISGNGGSESIVVNSDSDLEKNCNHETGIKRDPPGDDSLPIVVSPCIEKINVCTDDLDGVII